jgi:3-oxoacyl-[acyl-carrier protein] reductase
MTEFSDSFNPDADGHVDREGNSRMKEIRFHGRVAVVTGAGRGIGRAYALLLGQRGAKVVVNDLGGSTKGTGHDPAPAQEVADQITKAGGTAIADSSDVSTVEGGQRAVDAATSEFGRVDIVVNNAGAARGEDRVPVIDLPIEQWRTVIDVNLNGTFYMSRAFGRRLVAQGDGGSIVNISSIGGKMMAARTAAYAASKAGIHALTCAMASELGHDDIRVNAICPGIIDTYRLDDIPRGERWDAMVERQIPLGRAGAGEDIGWMTVYLCSDQGSWITGQLYTVDGGTLPGR